jgi:hypothetical protein
MGGRSIKKRIAAAAAQPFGSPNSAAALAAARAEDTDGTGTEPSEPEEELKKKKAGKKAPPPDDKKAPPAGGGGGDDGGDDDDEDEDDDGSDSVDSTTLLEAPVGRAAKAKAKSGWLALLKGFGMNPETIKYIQSQGLGRVQDFDRLRPSEMDDFFTHLTKNRPANVTLGYTSKRYLMVLKTWLNFRNHVDASIDLRHFTHEQMEMFEARLDEIASIEKAAKQDKDSMSKAKPLKKASDWPIFEQQFLQELEQHRNVVTHVPLTYVVRKHCFADDNPEAPAIGRCSSVDEALYHHATISGLDDKRVWDLLYSLTYEGELYSFIQKFKKKQQGRNAFVALKLQCEGDAGKAAMKQAAYSAIASAVYSGNTTRFTFDDYVAKHQKAHNDLERLSEPIAESKKVKDFLDNLTDPRMQMAKTAVMGDAARMQDFTATQQYLKTVYETIKTSSTRTPRNVGGLGTEDQDNGGRGRGRGRGGKKDGGRGRGGRGGKKGGKAQERVRHGHYGKEEWDALTEDERKKVVELRMARKRSISALSAMDDNPYRNGHIPAPTPPATGVAASITPVATNTEPGANGTPTVVDGDSTANPPVAAAAPAEAANANNTDTPFGRRGAKGTDKPGGPWKSRPEVRWGDKKTPPGN